jgi:amylosucrase
MYNYTLHQQVNDVFAAARLNKSSTDELFYTRLLTNAPVIQALYNEVYGTHEAGSGHFQLLLTAITHAYVQRSAVLRRKDVIKQATEHWFTSNQLAGMSLYVDRFCGNLNNLEERLDYLLDLGVNLLHLMPLFESPKNESDGGYAVSDFRKVDERFGTLEDLQALQQKMEAGQMYLMIDIVLNHTSHQHEWAKKARAGDAIYQDYYYMFADRQVPDQFEKTMPEIFPETSPGNFVYVSEAGKWVMSVFHHYQWDLNYSNPAVFIAMLENIFFYANIGVDVLRIDAPAFIWKQLGTTCQNLPKAHTLLRLIKQCVQVAAPGMALLGEAIVAPAAIMEYFGSGIFSAKECDFAYNATQMALQWDALATGDTRVMRVAQPILQQKPAGASWITYVRCHDDIGLGYDDYMIEQIGFNAWQHRQFLNDYYTGAAPGSPASGALFSYNPKTGDARISGSLASLCGLEKALFANDEQAIDTSIQKILLMQAQTFFLGGLPMLYYGDEAGYTNDYSYLQDTAKSYDNRWMHRPLVDWEKNKRTTEKGTIEDRIFSAVKRLLTLRRQLDAIADRSNIVWIAPHNIHVAAFVRRHNEQTIFCVFNYSDQPAMLTWYAFKEHGFMYPALFDHWGNTTYTVGKDHEYLELAPYQFCICEGRES